jgi:hypothetical protein
MTQPPSSPERRSSLFRFFPGAREVAAEFPSLAVVISDFVAAGFAVEHLQTVQQTVCGSLAELADRTRLRADTTLTLLADSEFARGQSALEDAAAAERQATPVVETLDLLVLGSP